nr:MAG TPA: lipoprotein [Caudoviricetes sp.]
MKKILMLMAIMIAMVFAASCSSKPKEKPKPKDIHEKDFNAYGNYDCHGVCC